MGLAATPDGSVVIVGTVTLWVGLYFSLPYSGIVTHTEDLGQSWTEWERLQSRTWSPVMGLVSTDDQFVTLLEGSVTPDAPTSVYSRTLNPALATAAHDWQLYQ
jgi:hypothetical protein